MHVHGENGRQEITSKSPLFPLMEKGVEEVKPRYLWAMEARPCWKGHGLEKGAGYYQGQREVETSCINLIVGDRLTEEKKKKKTLFTGSLKAENTTKVKVGPYSGFI